jgi:hypothetical protein
MAKPLHALVLTYGLRGKTTDPAAYEELSEALAPAFAAVPGLVSEVWLASRSRNRFGGFYLFDSRASFDAFVAGELFGTVWSHRGLTDRQADDFEVASGPTALTGGVLLDVQSGFNDGNSQKSNR